MTCSRESIESYLDKELSASVKAEVEEHLALCRACSETYARLKEQQTSIRAIAPYTAPVVLQHSVREALLRAAARETTKRSPDVPWRWAAIAASILLALSLGWNIERLSRRPIENDLLAQEILTSHVRSMIGTHLLDVPSSDQHTVKPWFSGKLDFSPQVKDLAPQGFPLTGGRMEYLAGRRVAALVFARRQHVVNLFTWPDTSVATSADLIARDGYNLLHWTDAGMTYWAVSDIPVEELRLFRNAYIK